MYNDIVHTEEFNGFTINIMPDTDARNPFTEWDCEPPIAVYSVGNCGIDEYSTGYGEVDSIPVLTRGHIKANLTAILELLDIKTLFEVRQYKGDTQYSYDLVECVNYALESHVDSLNDSDRLEALCDLYRMAGMPAVVKSVHGYSQGDWAKVLAVATPEFQEACGNDSDFDWIPSLESSIQLFGDWAFGNVYGYQVEDANGDEVDSCWGFYGDYDAPFGAVHEAEAAINWHIACDKKERIEKIKTWIRNRVPLHHRLTV